jgi:hypothetical protein
MAEKYEPSENFAPVKTAALLFISISVYILAENTAGGLTRQKKILAGVRKKYQSDSYKKFQTRETGISMYK